MNYNRGGEIPEQPREQAVRAIETEQRYQQDLVAVDQLRENPAKPSTKQQLLSDYEIRIRFLSRGCIVSVGCKEIAFSTVEDAMLAIQSYIEDPKKAGAYWRGEFNMI